jgi:endo-1,3(4)-beta-glucanase
VLVRNSLLLALSLSVVALSGCSSDDPGCQGGTVSCAGACVDTQLDELNCGTCGNACGAGKVCSGGTCALSCGAGLVACGASCIDPQSDEAHCGASGDCSGANAGTACTAGQSCVDGGCVPSCAPVALDLDTPFATATPPFTSRPGQQTPSSLWASTAAPLPTNTSWQNLVLGAGGQRVDFVPYQIKAEPVWLDVARAAPVTSATSVDVPDLKQIMLGALQFDGGTQHVVLSYDLLSATLRYSKAGAGTMTAPLVYGMPYVTVEYAGALRPMLIPGQYSFTSVNGSTSPGSVSGTRFQLVLSDGSTWVLYASSSITFNWTTGNMVAASTYLGTLRVANLPGAGAAAVLDAHAAAIPRGGKVEVSVACDAATLRFVYDTTGTGTLLLMAMPHHLAPDRLVSPVKTGLTYESIRGTLTGVEGSTWEMSLPLSTIEWTAPAGIAPTHLQAVKDALAVDRNFVPDPATVAGDTYFGGKQLAKLARLALIADELGDTATAATLRQRLTPLVAAWLDGTNGGVDGNHLVYDTTWGGVVTRAGLADPFAEFGAGHYNDHHFHYGYHLYAAAALARADPTFAADHLAGLLALVRDIANPSAADPKFPRFRHMDFFRGHSWAAGLSEFFEGQNQESTSEAVNAWYALDLLGLAIGDTRMRDLGRVLLALEIDAARTYWQIPLASTIYQDPFAKNRSVGILFQTRAYFGTFFGANPEYVYGIQMLPFTPVSEELISPAWIGDAWLNGGALPNMSAAAAGAAQEWRGLLQMAHATADKEQAWTEVSALTAWDDGNSKTNTLWWVASRP